jgi:peptidoglycan hydrolase-like protein with peptidoglycan-binding domain
MGPLLPILGLGGAGLLAYKVYEDQKQPELQSLRHTDPVTGMPVQVVVPVDGALPRLSVTDVPIAGVNAQVIRSVSPGAQYAPPTVVKKQQTPGRLDLLPTVITPTGASTLAVLTLADVQNALNTLGYGPLTVDGKMGSLTAGAVAKFQKSASLSPDGNPGPQTKAALQSTLATLAAPNAAIGAHPAVATATAATPAQVALGVGVGLASTAIGPKATATINKTVQTGQAVASAASSIKSLFSGTDRSKHHPHTPKSFFGFDLLSEYERGYRDIDPRRMEARPYELRQNVPGYGPRYAPYDRSRFERPFDPRLNTAEQGAYPGSTGLGRGPWSGGSTLSPGQSIRVPTGQDHRDIKSNGKVALIFQADGNLVLYAAPLLTDRGSGKIKSQPLWASGTDGKGASSLTMQEDGNLAVLDPNGQPLWSSATGGNPGAKLEVRQADAVIRSPRTGAVLWSASQGQSPSGVQPVGLSTSVRPAKVQVSAAIPTVTVGPQGVSATPSSMSISATPPSASIVATATSPGVATSASSAPASAPTSVAGFGYADADRRFDPLYSSIVSPGYLPEDRYAYGRPVRRYVETVSDVQTALNLLGASPPLDVDGNVGHRTAAAIRAFQIMHGMLADGFAGPKTKTALTLSVIATGQRSDFGLTLFTLFGREPPCVGTNFGAVRAARPAPPTGQMVGGRFVPAAGAVSGHRRHRHHHHHNSQEQQQQDPGGGGGGDSGGGGGGDSGGGGGGGDGGGGSYDDGDGDGDDSDMSGVGGAFG